MYKKIVDMGVIGWCLTAAFVLAILAGVAAAVTPENNPACAVIAAFAGCFMIGAALAGMDS